MAKVNREFDDLAEAEYERLEELQAPRKADRDAAPKEAA